MDILSSLALGIPTFIILLGPLMIVHELGHFWAARKAGIKVEEFGLGIPPRAVTLFTRGETIYSLNWLPLGAFVRLYGEGVDDNMNDPRAFAAASARWRFITILAGPVMNFLAAIIIVFMAYLFFATQPSEIEYRITQVQANSPAQTIGLQASDIIQQVNGVDVTKLTNESQGRGSAPTPLSQQVRESIGKPINILVLRNGQPTELKGTMPSDPNNTAPLGIFLDNKITKSSRIAYSIPDAFGLAVRDLFGAVETMILAPINIISGRMSLEQARPTGVVGITSIGVSLVRQMPMQGPFPFIWFAGILSLLIGLTNLLPFPALDGGRLTFIIIEWLRGRRVDPAREQWIHAAGMAVLLVLFCIITVFDILNPIR
ncbi:MAG: M50 family metallopeptidase [Chloroflexi bacterium]|nr:M50 family metallopeptidase [Chloroflexota bacterium]